VDVVAFLAFRLFTGSDMGRCVGVGDGLAASGKEFSQVTVAGHALRAWNDGLRRGLLVAALARQARLLMSLEAGGGGGSLTGIMQGYDCQG
jgi:hypothetical protein